MRRYLNDWDQLSLLRAMADVPHTRSGFLLKCPVCSEVSTIKDMNAVQHTSDCWKIRAIGLLGT